MPLLDIATPQPSFRTDVYSIRFQRVQHVSFIFSNQSTIRWRYFPLPGNANSNINRSGALVIKAVATLEPRCADKDSDKAQHPGVDSSTTKPATDKQSLTEDEKERLRRKRISKANKGNNAWNKGLRHSPETRKLISERTRIAMQSPKVKMKLLKAIHGQSAETRLKIGAGVRRTWEKRRERQMIQEDCHLEWLNLIAEASRKGFRGQEELQWESYEIISEQLTKEWQESVEERKKKKPKGCRRAPKSLEQRRKISEAIAAKWADPSYRDRVHSGIAKYRGNTGGVTKPKWVTSERDPKKANPPKKSQGLDGLTGNMSKSKSEEAAKLKRSSKPMYKDPQASSKLEMIKSIRAQRAVADTKRSEAVARANLLIGEAQRAAEALEVAAANSPMAQASLVETRKLIAEAIRYIKSVETGNTDVQREVVNGVGGIGLSDEVLTTLGLSKLDRQDEDDDEHVMVNGKEHIHVSSLGELGLQTNRIVENKVEAAASESEKQEKQGIGKGKGKGRRWVCGKLVEDD